MRGNKAQVAMEFLWMYGFALLLLFTFAVIFAAYVQGYLQDRNVATAREQVYDIQQEIIVASTVHDGYLREFTINNQIGFDTFVAYVNDTWLYANYSDRAYTLRIPEVSGQLQSGTNQIRRVNGEVRIN